MVAAATVHAFSTEMLIGSMTFAVLTTCLRLLATFTDRIGQRAEVGLDAAAFYAAIFALVMIPIVAITGNASGNAAASPLLVNKVLLSGLCLGLWIGVVHGRRTWGPDLWTRRSMALFHTGLVCAGYGVAAMLGSIGELLTRGETVGDILGIWPHFGASPTIGFGMSITLAILSLMTLLVVLFLQPKGEPVDA